MLTRNLIAVSLAAALVAAAPVAFAQHERDYRDDHREDRHDMRRDHREFERERIAREHRYEYARHHDYRVYEHAPRGYAVATPVFVPPPVYASPASLNIVVPITLP